jgi:hypothetical protein
MSERAQIILKEEHRGVESNTFTGRPQGKQVREQLDLSDKDCDDKTYDVFIPKNTISFNASFYLGLFYESIKFLKGTENFHQKYKIVYLEVNDIVRKGLEDDISECRRQAKNEFLNKTGLDL